MNRLAYLWHRLLVWLRLRPERYVMGSYSVSNRHLIDNSEAWQ